MISEPQTASLFAREQFRMTRLQVYNWGTFSGLHDVPISERGFLFVGRSGAGKSTLLDAFSALLTPPRWIDFNAAAREADRSGRDRNLVTYIRGAWAEQKDGESGEIATRYLRSGTTWSALALSYQNALGQSVVLVQVFWLRGNANGSTDVKRHYLVMERTFDLRELEDFGQSNFDIRKLKQSFPEAFARDEFRPYCERFCRLLGIESEMALRLLHKTQSAKNLGDLNTFLRDFMLDKPETFEVADRLVSEFGELNAAHQAVVTAREQVQTLAPAREQHQRRDSLSLQRNGLDVMVIDKAIFPRDKVCAGWITPTVVKTLDIDLDDYGKQHILQPITGFKVGSLGSKFVQLNLIVILVSVPDGVVSRYGIISIVINLVYTCSRETVSADSASYPRRIVHALVGAGAERRKQSSFRLQIIFLGAGLGELRLLKSAVVGKRIVDTVFQRPLFCLRSQWCRRKEHSRHCVFYFSVHYLLLFSFFPVLFISESSLSVCI